MKPLFATLALLVASNVHASVIDSVADSALLYEVPDTSTTETFTYDSVIRYFNANSGRVPTLQELAPSRICIAFKPGSQVVDGSVGVGIFSQSNYKVILGGLFAGWIRQSANWSAEQLQQARNEAAKLKFLDLIKNGRNAQEFVVQFYSDASFALLEIEIKIRKSPSDRYYFIAEGVQANSGLRLNLYAGVCEPTSIFAGSKFPL